MNFIYWIGGFLTMLAAIIFYYPAFFYIFLFIIYSVILIILAIAGTIYVHFFFSIKSISPTNYQASNTLYNATSSSIFDLPKPAYTSSQMPIIMGRTVDGLIIQIIDYTFRDFISPWLGYVIQKPKNLIDVLKEDIWNGIQKLKERAVKVDGPKMIAVDMTVRVTVHLEKLRIAQARSSETGNPPMFATTSYLVSEEKELEFLRKLCEIMIIFLLPRGYSMSPLKHLLSEILSFKIFYPMIKMITSPDYINQKIVQYIETRLAAAAINKRTYEYAASFEDLLKIINTTQSTDELLMMRSSIVNDILKATTIQNLQRAKGFDPDAIDQSNTTLTKAQLSAGMKLKRYIQQLSFAKVQCEKSLAKLGWNGNFSNDLNLTLPEILSTVVGRRHFVLYLEKLQASDLIGFYTSVEELKHSAKSSYHQLGSEIFYTYIRAPSSTIKVDKPIRKKMESFLLGDNGPEVFYDVQRTVFRTLEDKYYSPFLSSEQYQELKTALNNEDIKDIGPFVDNTDDPTIVNESDVQIEIVNHSTYARNKLEQLQEKLENKNQALDALKSSLKPESKLLSSLDKELDWLKMEKRQLEAHLSRTEVWAEHLGKWRAIVQSVEVPDEKEPPQFMILVQVDENMPVSNHSNDNGNHIENENISTGWVVLRSLTEFHELHRKLRPLCPELKSFDLPTNAFKLFFLKNDKSSLERAKGTIQKYLNFILEDDDLYQSEAIYTFLSPSSENLKNGTPSPKKSKFSLATLFKTNSGNNSETIKNDPFWGPCGPRDGEEDISMFLEGVVPNDAGAGDGNNQKNSSNETDGKDSIAEPLYALMGEVFDMGGVFKFLRRSLISFVQITYGRTINRQIRDTINFLFEESMLHYYASTALKSFWPGGALASAHTERTEDMQEMTGIAAKSLLIDNVPEVMCNLVGSQTAKHGALKAFNTVQNAIYNKQLFYELLEILMLELFPEIRQLKPITTTTTKSSTTSK